MGATTDVLGNNGGRLSTIDCIAQSLAIGPILSATVLGSTLFGLSGGVAPFVVILTTVGILGLGYVISELAKRFTGTGTVYELVAHTIGRPPAVFAAGAYHLAAIALYTGIPILGSVLIKDFCSAHFGFDPPWWIVAVALVAITIGINLIGIRAAVRTQLTLVTASVVPFLILAVAVVVDGGPNGNSADAFNAGTIAEGGSVLKGLLVAIVMFVGFELAASLGEETARPHRSIPIAIIASIVICAAFYVLTLYVGTIGSGGPDRLPFDFAELARSYVGRWLGVLIELAIILDVIAVGIGFAAATSRGLLTLARDGVLPSRLAAVNDVAVPMNAAYTVAGCGLVGIVIGLVVYGTSTTAGSPDVVDQFLVTTTIGAFVICVVYALVAIGGIAFFAREDLQPAAVVAGLVGLATAGAGVTAQFVDGTAPVGDARWGRHLGLVVLAVVAVWLGVTTARRRTAVRPAGDRAIGPAA